MFNLSDREQEYAAVVSALAEILAELDGKLIAIGGSPCSGKTTLGRFLACRFNVSLIETDLFRLDGNARLTYRNDEIDRIINSRLMDCRPVILEGATVLRILSQLGRKHEYLIHVTNNDTTAFDCLSEDLAADLKKYDAEFSPRSHANLILELNHNG